MVYEKLAQYGPLPVRILAGIAFMSHGLPKLSNVAGAEDFFANMIGLPPEMALPVGLLEVIGGIALLAGALTRVASILFIIEMIGSTIVAKLSRGFVGGYELDLLLMAISVSLLLTGPGRISIEWNVLKRELFPKGKQIVLEQLQKR
ncbi:MAG TPA: DoxX family protein [Nitrososphaera sp.]|jgi:putative oxidoreductase|nr:DoxX family protein [Nitrososphaera sp.]